MITVVDLNIHNFRIKYNSLMQYAIKKGNKNKIENTFRTLLFFIKNNPQIYDKFKFDDITKAFAYTNILMGVKIKRKGSKNIHVPIRFTPSRSNYLSCNSIITHANQKTNKYFYKNLADELIESSKKKSLSTKKSKNLYDLVESSLKSRANKVK